MFQFPGLPPCTYVFSTGSLDITPVGFSYSEIRVSLTACVSARLFAAYRVLRRLLAPRHSPHALLFFFDLLVSVRSMCHHTYTPDLSTSYSLWCLINFRCGKSHLKVRFTLRCFQRLSSPDLATQLCSWQNNWFTSGLSNPVLSY